jgi:hypothetical protein
MARFARMKKWEPARQAEDLALICANLDSTTLPALNRYERSSPPLALLHA